MAPTYRAGERVTLVRRRRAVRVGDVVVAPDPREPSRLLFKRCVATSKEGLELRGDNPGASTDSRHFGPLATRRVTWVVARSSWRPAPGSR